MYCEEAGLTYAQPAMFSAGTDSPLKYDLAGVTFSTEVFRCICPHTQLKSDT